MFCLVTFLVHFMTEGEQNLKTWDLHYSCFKSGKVIAGMEWGNDEELFKVKCCPIGKNKPITTETHNAK